MKSLNFIITISVTAISFAQGIVRPEGKRLKINNQIVGFIKTNEQFIEGFSNKNTHSSLQVYQLPTLESLIIPGIISQYDIDSVEFEEDDFRIAVYGKKNYWYQVKIKNGIGWIPKNHVAEFTSFDQFAKKASMIDEWDGKLFKNPFKNSALVMLDWIDQGPLYSTSVNVLEVRKSDGQLWMRIRILGHNSKQIDDTDIIRLKVKTSGWIPAFDRKGTFICFYYTKD